MSPSGRYQLIAAEVSLYSGKARSYLRYKQIPFDEVLSTRTVIEQVVAPRTGLRMIPVLISDDDVAVQDTTAIIDFCEARVPERSVYPSTARQRLAALLLELFGDEWLVLPAMHYRWHYRRNLGRLLSAFGQLMAPRAPSVLWPAAGLPLAAHFGRTYGPMLGVSSANRATLEARYELFLYAFDRHLAAHPFLLGGRPSIGDFGLMGPLYAVLSRDPYPAELMRRIAPRVVDWVERMNHPPQTFGPWCPDDQVPVTLDPIFEALFTDMWPMIEATVRAVTAWVQANPERPRLSRFVGKHELVIGDTIASRRAQSLTQWMAQRPLEHYHGLAMTARPAVDIWLERVGGWEAMQLEIPTWLRRCEDNRLAVTEPPL